MTIETSEKYFIFDYYIVMYSYFFKLRYVLSCNYSCCNTLVTNTHVFHTMYPACIAAAVPLIVTIVEIHVCIHIVDVII